MSHEQPALPAPYPRPVWMDVHAERLRQEARWGQQNHPDSYAADDRYTPASYSRSADYWKRVNAERVAEQNALGTPPDRNSAWDGILLEEAFEALAETDPALRRAELIQVAAVAVAMIEALDRRVLGPHGPEKAADFAVGRVSATQAKLDYLAALSREPVSLWPEQDYRSAVRVGQMAEQGFFVPVANEDIARQAAPLRPGSQFFITDQSRFATDEEIARWEAEGGR